jgi:hypothetical protein
MAKHEEEHQCSDGSCLTKSPCVIIPFKVPNEMGHTMKH